jgi:hypothetical protein
VTTGIKTSCIHKRDLYLNCRNSNDTKLKQNYKPYYKISSEVIKVARKLHYDETILNSNTKMKTTWNIIKSEMGKEVSKVGVHLLNTDGNLTNSRQTTANSFNNYCLTISDKTTDNERNNEIGVEE